MKNNPEWKPFIEAVKKADVTSWNERFLCQFIGTYPVRLHAGVALALSLAKWHMIITGSDDIPECDSVRNCGCCALWWHHGLCTGCLLTDSIKGYAGCIEEGNRRQIYDRILRIYTKHFNALPARDRQKARKS